MIVKQENKFVAFFKKFWMYILAGVLMVVIGTTLGVVFALRDNQGVVDVVKPGDGDNKEETLGGDENNKGDEGDKENEKPDSNPETLSFGLPMSNATIIKDYTDVKLEYNPTLDRWESHMYIDFTSNDLSVMSVLDGEILSVEYDYLTGYVVVIQHRDGFVSKYASLSDDVKVKKGDKIKKGDIIGQASNLAASSSAYGEHLEFTLLKDDKKIDPNNYLDLQEK